MDYGQYSRKAKEFFAVKVVEGCLEELAFFPICATENDLPVRD